jgi:dihydroorotate dehydrogenase electron transfer subunit
VAEVREVRQENYRTRTLRLDAAVEAQPGQFAMLWLPGLDEKPFSLMNADPLSFTIAAVGPFSRAIHALEPGDKLWWRGPLGQGFTGGDDLLLVGGGYGVAPLLFLAGRSTAARVRAVVGARTADDLLLVDALRRTGAEVRVATEDGSAGTAGLVTAVVQELVEARRPGRLCACGPHGMLHALETLACREGIPAELAWEAYMRCGIGICGSCEHGGNVLCADGPVLSVGATPNRGETE